MLFQPYKYRYRQWQRRHLQQLPLRSATAHKHRFCNIFPRNQVQYLLDKQLLLVGEKLNEDIDWLLLTRCSISLSSSSSHCRFPGWRQRSKPVIDMFSSKPPKSLPAPPYAVPGHVPWLGGVRGVHHRCCSYRTLRSHCGLEESKEAWRYGTEGHGLVTMVVIGQQMDLVIPTWMILWFLKWALTEIQTKRRNSYAFGCINMRRKESQAKIICSSVG